MTLPMSDRAQISPEIPAWVRLAIADAVILFGRMEQDIIEIAWAINDADLKKKLRLARVPATVNFVTVLEIVEKAQQGMKLEPLKQAFIMLANDRNLMVHGSWHMVDERPWVVWHKFLEDNESVVGEFFERQRFEKFMLKGERLWSMLRSFHDMLEEQAEIKSSVIPRS